MSLSPQRQVPRSLLLCAAQSMICVVNAVVVSLIAVAGTLLGSFSTYVFQRRTALHVESAARHERLREERLVVCGAFAAAVTEVKRAVISAWFRRDVHDDEWRAAMTDADRMGAATEAAQIRLLLVIDDAELRRLADAVSAQIGVIRGAADKAELEAREVEFATARSAFITAARQMMGDRAW